jgi:hypothetical protein
MKKIEISECFQLPNQQTKHYENVMELTLTTQRLLTDEGLSMMCNVVNLKLNTSNTITDKGFTELKQIKILSLHNCKFLSDALFAELINIEELINILLS